MNEVTFLIQIFFILLFSFAALRLGKGALLTAVAVQAIFANFFVLQQIDLFGFSVTSSDAFAIGSMLCLNLLRENFGKEESKGAISISFFFMVFFVVMSGVHVKFHPNQFDTTHSSYLSLLTPAPRLLIASIVAFFLSQHLDLRIFGWVFKRFPNASFSVRSSISLSLSQLFDTIFFTLLGLFGIVAHIFDVILISFLVKACIIFLMAPLISLSQKMRGHV